MKFRPLSVKVQKTGKKNSPTAFISVLNREMGFIMFGWLIKLNKKSIVLSITIIAAIIFSTYYYNRINKNATVGWEAIKSAQVPFKPGIVINGQPPAEQVPFKPGIIINGQPPADFEISLIEPGSRSPITTKPANPRQFVASVKITDDDASNSDTPPTFLYIIIFNHDKQLYKVNLTPSAKDDRGYLYSGQVTAPKKVGDYEVAVEAEYAIYDNSSGKPERLKPFRKTLKGIILHVSN